jgi:hypothetical protein
VEDVNELEAEPDKMRVDDAKTEGDVKKSVKATDDKDGAFRNCSMVTEVEHKLRLLQHFLVVATSFLEATSVRCAWYIHRF